MPCILRMFSLPEYMQISRGALEALQVMQSEIHPNCSAWSAGRPGASQKESLSVFGLFRALAGTPQGRTKLLRAFLRPFANVELIRERQSAVSAFVRPENGSLLQRVRQSLRGIPDIGRTTHRLRKGVDLSSGQQSSIRRSDWWTLAQSIFHCLQLRDLLQQLDPLNEASLISDASPPAP